MLGIEQEVRFKIGDYDAVGYIDLLLKDKSDGNIIILDHKSAALKFKKNGEISKKDAQHFLDFQRHLYLYSKPVIEQYGKVDWLVWNMFRQRDYIKVPWTEDGYNEALNWAENTIHRIEAEEEWSANPDYYYCHNLCGQRNICEYGEGMREVMEDNTSY